MAELVWDQVGDRFYETGVDHGVLYIPDEGGNYSDGVAWNGLVTITEKPGGAAATAQYADNVKYLNLRAAETFAATIEAFTYPPEFEQFDGLSTPTPGVNIGQQSRGMFGLSYRTLIGNDVDGNDYGYKLHLVYGLSASPSEKAFGTVNDTPAPINFSWDVDSVPVAVTNLKPASLLTVNSTEVGATQLTALLEILYGTEGVDPRLPLPDEIVTLMSGGAPVEVTALAPTYDAGTNTITIPVVAHVEYLIAGEVVSGDVVITEDTLVHARPTAGYVLKPGTDDDFFIVFS